MAEHFAYYDFTDDTPLRCESCGWSGHGRDVSLEMVSLQSELCDASCPRCDTLVAIVPFPAHAEVREAAAAGHAAAIAELPNVEAREAFLTEARSRELEGPDQLPEIEEPSFRLTWDQQGEDTVILLGEREIWRERAYFEGSLRFVRVFEILEARYGDRLVAMYATAESYGYLGGDHFAPEYRQLMSRMAERRPPV